MMRRLASFLAPALCHDLLRLRFQQQSSSRIFNTQELGFPDRDPKRVGWQDPQNCEKIHGGCKAPFPAQDQR